MQNDLKTVTIDIFIINKTRDEGANRAFREHQLTRG